MKRKIKTYLYVLMTAVLCMSLFSGCGASSEEKEAERIAFQESVDAVVNGAPDNITGDKAITLLHKLDDESPKGTYTTQYVPEEYQTENPEEIRFLITCTEDHLFVGLYTGAPGCSAYRYNYPVEVRDLKYGTSKEYIFTGGEPPQSISVKQGEVKVFYGSKPDEEMITAWVLSTIEDLEQGVNAAETEFETETESETETETIAETIKETKELTPQEAALEKALDMLSYDTGFSPSDLEMYLTEYEGVDSANAKYAVENCGADWMEEALKCAISYSGYGISYVNMYKTLIMNHGFTEEQAQNAVDNCGADWKQEAVNHISFMLEYEAETYSAYTREEWLTNLIDIYGFTEEEAIYGVDQHGLK